MSGTILDTIIARKREEIAERRRSRGIAELEAAARESGPARGFADAMRRAAGGGGSAVIAEIKKASPSKGVIRESFDPVAIAESYEAAGATCLSVLTDRDFFAGHEDYLRAARAAVSLPVLRKDFIVDPYQVLETRAIGADCMLLIVAALEPTELAELHEQAVSLGIDVLVEVHDEAELELALALRPRLVGINNRDLRTFETRLETTVTLASIIGRRRTDAASSGEAARQERAFDDCLVITESGIHTRTDVAAMHAAGVHAFLVGEAFMRAPDPGVALREMFRREA